MSKQELRIERVEPGSEANEIAAALDRVEPGDLVVYHRGVSGSAPRSIKEAAAFFCEMGRCLLTQRITGGSYQDGERIVDYLAIKTRGEP